MTKKDIFSLARKEILKLIPYKSARDDFSSDQKKMIMMDANENPFENELNRYPDPMQLKLKKRISESKKVNLGHIYLGNGSDDIINQLIIAFCRPNVDSILICPPTFGMYEVHANLNLIKSLKVPLNMLYELEEDSIFSSIQKNTKIIFIPNPNNPTGNSFSNLKIQRLIDNFNGIVAIDEAYFEFYEGDSFLPKISKYKNLVVIQTFSKGQGLAGARLGMCFANKYIIEILNKIKAPYNINSLTIDAALKKLDEQGIVYQQVSEIVKEKKRLLNEIKNVKFIKQIYKSDANFFMIKVDNGNKRYQQLLELGIVVRNTSKYHNCKNTLRITVGKKDENNALISVLSKMDV
tara:strand:+ start:23 stop:1072 length:1050 start_codon:yes stop_codon:yes gene_type:complete